MHVKRDDIHLCIITYTSQRHPQITVSPDTASIAQYFLRKYEEKKE